eukprot:TRINITY_DN34982_c0_g1_i1.p1 TRINITY_DN34982_c0_g1~~TRINITY_DN34982_c0_g1_i1.p1  ORF type:complete len:223 (-),score=38.24 TRINITY_DN34982_c0_g1_i1:305-973(-)
MQHLTFNEALREKPLSDILPEEDGDTQVALLQPMPLQDTWVLWEMRAGGSYADSMKEVVAFKTAQEFWSIWNGVPQPSILLDSKRIIRAEGSTQTQIDAIMLFKQGIRPEWEDPLNAKGGHLQIQLKPSIGGAQIDEYWNNIVLGMIGATIAPSDMITGIRLVDKLKAGMLRIELWFTRYSDTDAVNTLKKSTEQCFCQRLDGSQGIPVKFEIKSHDNTGKH